MYRDNMPPSIMTCFTVCALYSAVTEGNKSIVFRTLHQSISELDRYHTANTPQEKLARAQALFLYQTIRLFDGDLTLRSDADKDMELLLKWVDDLVKVRESIDYGTLSDLPRSWEVRPFFPLWSVLQSDPVQAWIFAESVRRTIMMAYAFVTAWGIMSGRASKDTCSFPTSGFLLTVAHEGDIGALAYAHRWTLSRTLWEAPSSFDFYKAWTDRPQYIISTYDFDEFLSIGSGHDVDDFAKICLVTYVDAPFAPFAPFALCE